MAQHLSEIKIENELSQDLLGLTRAGLTEVVRNLGAPEIHAKTLFRRIYKDLSTNPWSEPTLPLRLVAAMQDKFAVHLPRVKVAHRSAYDQSMKFLVGLGDGREVEAVLMPEKARLTLCLSSQVGCAQGCVFCHTGRMGLVRQLSVAEIVGQVMLAEHWLREHPEWLESTRLAPGTRISNIVFMGMGEPLDNVEAVIDVLSILTDPYGLALGMAHISVSTAGHLVGIDRLYDAHPKARLALSVHSPDESKRSRIMPINRRWPLTEVIGRLRERIGKSGPPVMMQYTMIAGVNDSDADASALAALTVGLNAKINLIPLNNVEPSRLSAPPPERIQAFRDVLHQAGIRVMVRYSKGQDIAAACGQLVAFAKKPTEAELG